MFIPASGWTADRFGARSVFRAAIFVFMLGSIGCAFANSLEGFVVARIVQGMGGAMMTPVGRLVLVRTIAMFELTFLTAGPTSQTLVVALYLWANGVYPDFWVTLRHTAFNLVAIDAAQLDNVAAALQVGAEHLLVIAKPVAAMTIVPQMRAQYSAFSM